MVPEKLCDISSLSQWQSYCVSPDVFFPKLLSLRDWKLALQTRNRNVGLGTWWEDRRLSSGVRELHSLCITKIEPLTSYSSVFIHLGQGSQLQRWWPVRTSNSLVVVVCVCVGGTVLCVVECLEASLALPIRYQLPPPAPTTLWQPKLPPLATMWRNHTKIQKNINYHLHGPLQDVGLQAELELGHLMRKRFCNPELDCIAENEYLLFTSWVILICDCQGAFFHFDRKLLSELV